MLNHPDTEPPTPSGKLVLPDPSDEEQRVASGQHSAQIHPGLLIRPTTPPAPAKVLPKLVWYWRKDPAYKVFMIAIAAVVVASLVFVSLVSAALFGHSSPGTSLSQTPGKVTPGGTVDLHPTFPKPTGGNGSSQSSQPPAQSTPVVGPGDTPTAGPTVTTQPGGPLTIQITGYPSAVSNGSRVDHGQHEPARHSGLPGNPVQSRAARAHKRGARHDRCEWQRHHPLVGVRLLLRP
jgi:hypothetical protein